MNIADIMTKVKEQILERDLIPITGEEKETLENLIKNSNLDINDFYVNDKLLDRYVYWKNPIYASFPVLDPNLINHYLKSIEVKTEEFNKGNYTDLLLFADTGTIITLNNLYWKLSKEERYKTFIDVYTHIDRGYSLIDPLIIKDVLKNKPDINNDLPDEIVIYRGEGTKSTTYTETYSWTTDIEIACFFAVRLSLSGKIYQAKINKKNIIAFITDRNENEIIVLPEHLKEVKEIPMDDTMETMKKLQNEGYLEEYMLYRNTFISSNDYKEPNGIHGISHVKRVLIHCLNLSRILNLSDMERGMLAMAAIYHDIGRINDEEDTIHGIKSWKKFKKKNKPLLCINVVPIVKETGTVDSAEYHLEPIDYENEKIIKFIIENHCISDDKAIETLNKSKIENKQFAWNLYCIFKDADGLDRVRLDPYLGEVDIKYFRNKETVNQLLFAKILLDNTQAFSL